MAFLAIDPGVYGAFAVFNAKGKLQLTREMPTIPARLKKKTSRKEVDPEAVADLMNELVDEFPLTHAFIEDVNAMPRDGRTGAFTFGHAKGIVEGVCAAHGIAINYVSPREWTRRMNIFDKEHARQLAVKIFPRFSLILGKEMDPKYGRVDAVLIGVYGHKHRASNK